MHLSIPRYLRTLTVALGLAALPMTGTQFCAYADTLEDRIPRQPSVESDRSVCDSAVDTTEKSNSPTNPLHVKHEIIKGELEYARRTGSPPVTLIKINRVEYACEGNENVLGKLMGLKGHQVEIDAFVRTQSGWTILQVLSVKEPSNANHVVIRGVLQDAKTVGSTFVIKINGAEFRCEGDSLAMGLLKKNKGHNVEIDGVVRTEGEADILSIFEVRESSSLENSSLEAANPLNVKRTIIKGLLTAARRTGSPPVTLIKINGVQYACEGNENVLGKLLSLKGRRVEINAFVRTQDGWNILLVQAVKG